MELHSQIAPALVGLRLATEAAGASYPRVAYLMPDTAALPLALSETIPLLKERGWLHAVITCGQAFGGDYEAVNLGSGMLVAAGPARCDVLIAAQGPGNAGTASALGFGGLFQSEAMHLAVALGGDPILTARMSESDPRQRHRGLSHHTRAILERMLLAPVTLPLPDAGCSSPALSQAVEEMGSDGRLAFGRHPVTFAPADALRKGLRESDLPFSSMGRGLDDDPIFFLAAAAAGWVAGERAMKRGIRA
jgi:hypothetical protein